MTQQNAIQLFESKKVRTLWDYEQECWFFSIIDVIAVLTENDRPRKYWSDLKTKLRKEGSELSEKIGQLKMPAPDGKMQKTLYQKPPTPTTMKKNKSNIVFCSELVIESPI